MPQVQPQIKGSADRIASCRELPATGEEFVIGRGNQKEANGSRDLGIAESVAQALGRRGRRRFGAGGCSVRFWGGPRPEPELDTLRRPAQKGERAKKIGPCVMSMRLVGTDRQIHEIMIAPDASFSEPALHRFT